MSDLRFSGCLWDSWRRLGGAAWRLCFLLVALATSRSEVRGAIVDLTQTLAVPLEGSIVGNVQVTDAPGALSPVRRALVTADGGARGVASAYTDVDGHYDFAHLAAGSYAIRVSKDGFVPAGERPSASVATLEIVSGEVAVADLLMERGSALEGRVTDEVGDPLVRVAVSALEVRDVDRGRRLLPVRETHSDDQGHFRLHTLASGDYVVSARSDIAILGAAAGPGGSLDVGFAASYFPGTLRPDDARTVHVAVGETARSLDFVARRVPFAAVTVEVVNQAGVLVRPPLMNAALIPVDGGAASPPARFVPREGAMTFTLVAPGDYWLVASVAASPREYAARGISVVAGDQQSVTVTTSQGTTVRGRVEADDGTALPPGLSVAVNPVDFVIPEAFSATSGREANVGPDGSFSLSDVFGRCSVRLGSIPVGWALRQISSAGDDVTDRPVDWATHPASLRILVTRRVGRVEGHVRDSAGRPVLGTRVVLFRQDRRQSATSTLGVYATSSHAEGAFEVKDVLPGRYFLAVSRDLDAESWLDPSVLDRLRSQAVAVEVTESGVTYSEPMVR